VAVLTICI